MSTASLHDAIAHYHELLQSRHLDSTLETLERANDEWYLRRPGNPSVRTLRPTFLPASLHARFFADGMQVIRALNASARRVFADEKLRGELRLEDSWGWRLRVDSGVRGTRVNGRLDGLVTSDGQLRFAEYNTNFVGGIVYSDFLPKVFAESPVMRAFGERFPVRSLSPRHEPYDALLEAHREAGGEGNPVFLIVAEPPSEGGDGETPFEVLEMMQLLADLGERGVAVMVMPAGELEYREGRLYAEGMAVDVLYVPDGDMPAFLQRFPVHHPLFTETLASGRVRFFNGASLGSVLADKSLFAMLTDPRFESLFDGQMREAIARTIPWTRVVSDSRTQFHGEAVDLLSFIASNRERLVLKPANGHSGEGVVLGFASDDAQWTRALKRAQELPYVVQERVDMHRPDYPRMVDGKLSFPATRYSADPFSWNDRRLNGYVSRTMSEGGVLNLSQPDSSLAPVFILESVERFA